MTEGMQLIRPVPGYPQVLHVELCSAGCCQPARPEGFSIAGHNNSDAVHKEPILHASQGWQAHLLAALVKSRQ